MFSKIRPDWKCSQISAQIGYVLKYPPKYEMFLHSAHLEFVPKYASKSDMWSQIDHGRCSQKSTQIGNVPKYPIKSNIFPKIRQSVQVDSKLSVCTALYLYPP